jgi:hypothetical protein
MTYSSDNNNINKDKDDDDKSYEEISVVLRLEKNIVQILRIFANTYGGERRGGSTEEKRIDNFLSEEVTKIIEALAEFIRTSTRTFSRFIKTICSEFIE